MIDMKAVSITGAFTVGKARLLWKDNTLKLFNKSGGLMVMKADRPIRRRGWINTYDVATEFGFITLKTLCWTCGGHWRIVWKSADALWNGDG